MIVDKNFTQINDLAKMVRREIERESEQLTKRMDQLTDLGQLIEMAEAMVGDNQRLQEDVGYLEMLLQKERAESSEYQDQLIEENKKMQKENEFLQQQLAEESKRRAELEMKIAEMSKLSTGVAKKASEEAVLQTLRTYVNYSKRKTADKRAFAKTATLEMANANGLSLPKDLAIMIESLDDEQTEARVVHVRGNYNDVHDNRGVRMNDNFRMS